MEVNFILNIDMPNCNVNKMELWSPKSALCLRPGYRVRLHRFESEEWVVGYGWFSFGGNRPMCGWFLTKDAGLTVKPLQLPDLDDIYIVKM